MNRTIRKVDPALPKAPKLLNVAAYARVSSEKDSMYHSLSAQVSHYSAFIQKHPGWRYAGVYADNAMTGTTVKRPEFQRLLADCRAGKIDLILTKSISRFARNTVTLLETVRELKTLGIDIFFEEQNIHSLSGEGELMLTILAAFAQAESLSVSENCKWRIQKKFEQGIPTTTQINGLKIDHGRITVIPEEAETVALIFALRRDGMGKNGIARELNRRGIPAKHGGIWHESVIDTILRNEKYQGDLLLQKQYRVDHLRKIDRPNRGELPQYLVQDNHEGIVTREVFAEVQASIRARAAQFPSGHGQRVAHPFSGKLVCARCGKRYRRRHNSGKIAWQCSTYMIRGKDYCAAKQVREEILESVCAQVLGLRVFDEATFEARVEHIDVCEDNLLRFHFYDRRVEEYHWRDPSRRDSWTEDMRLRAAEYARSRYEKGGGGQ